jgi:hypothetical protein
MPVSKIYAFGPVAVLALAAALCVCEVSEPNTGMGLKRIHDPRHVTYSIRLASCRFRDHGQLPDRSCTPGSIDPAVSQGDVHSTICRARWTETVRPPVSQTGPAKYQIAYPAYHLAGGAVSELDHLVPLELGGSNDITNLWPEVGKVSNNPKDKVENALNHAVCDGKVSLAAAQLAIASNWLTAEARLGLAPPHPSPSPTPSASPTPSPSPTHTVPALACRASMSSTSPHDYTTDYVNVTTAPYADIATTAYYKTTNNSKNGQADGGGQASIGYYISGATIGYTVHVSVTVTSGGQSASCSTAFTPSG